MYVSVRNDVYFIFIYCLEVPGVASESLVPGDILVVPPSGMDVPCDAVLLSGQVIANEAMLTGGLSLSSYNVRRACYYPAAEVEIVFEPAKKNKTEFFFDIFQ